MTPKTLTSTTAAAVLLGLCAGWIFAAYYGQWETLAGPRRVDSDRNQAVIYDDRGCPIGWE